MESGRVQRVGLLATNSIRTGTNRLVLERINHTGQIFGAWSDREWILDGAAVRVSIICFDDGSEREVLLDGMEVNRINPDLTFTLDVTSAARVLRESQGICFQGTIKRGPFDIPEDVAMRMIRTSNDDATVKNSDVIRLLWNAIDVTRRPRHVWVIDFGVNMIIEQARKYREPFEHVERHVKPMRAETNQATSRELWWLHWNPRPVMRKAIEHLSRFIVTPEVAKHRIFVWVSKEINPDHKLYVVARDDDYFFGVLHSCLHEVWSLRMGSWHGVGNHPRYTPTTTFETFPFPWPPGHEDTSSPAYQAIAAAAKRLHEERQAWLNPPGVISKALEKRTLTNLYNQLQAFRKTGIPTEPDDFARGLDDLHRALDQAVCDGYGWPHDILGDEEEMLRRLLALNLARAGEDL